MQTIEGKRRLRTIRPGIVVGEIALYTGEQRSADVVAEVPSRVLRLRRGDLGRMEREDPELTAALRRWFAAVLAERLGDTLRAINVLSD